MCGRAHLLVLDARDVDEQVHRRLQQDGVALCQLLDDRQVLPEEAREEEGDVLDERLVLGRAVEERLSPNAARQRVGVRCGGAAAGLGAGGHGERERGRGRVTCAISMSGMTMGGGAPPTPMQMAVATSRKSASKWLS